VYGLTEKEANQKVQKFKQNKPKKEFKTLLLFLSMTAAVHPRNDPKEHEIKLRSDPNETRSDDLGPVPLPPRPDRPPIVQEPRRDLDGFRH
jgi:hypothetical protein